MKRIGYILILITCITNYKAEEVVHLNALISATLSNLKNLMVLNSVIKQEYYRPNIYIMMDRKEEATIT